MVNRVDYYFLQRKITLKKQNHVWKRWSWEVDNSINGYAFTEKRAKKIAEGVIFDAIFDKRKFSSE